jgi:signal transduction histidine kinase
MATEYFTVDAALLQELGERLIGAPHIALAELVKNAYDADANTCRVIFGDDTIEVIDDGHGMTEAEFKKFWLRLGTQHKREEEYSPILERPFTGSKGVGRLAVQFLAAELELWTKAERPTGSPTLHAKIDWRNIASGETLRKVPVELNEAKKMPEFPNRHRHGTRIVLKRLRKRDWEEDDLEELGQELWALRSPFSALRGQRSDRYDATWFDVELTAPGIPNAEEAFNAKIKALTEQIWRAKITGNVKDGRQSNLASVSVEFDNGYPDEAEAETYHDEIRLSDLSWDRARLANEPLLDNVSFTIFVYKLSGYQAPGIRVDDLRDYLEDFGNVSVYDTGFRLPYYGMENDWLDIQEDQARRLSLSQVLDGKWVADKGLLNLPDPRRLFGSVEINTNREAKAAEDAGAEPGEWLLIQSSRDRLHPNKAYEQLRALVRYAVDLYANRYTARKLVEAQKELDHEPASRKYDRAIAIIENSTLSQELKQQLLDILRDSRMQAKKAEELADARMGVLAPLAAAGMTALGLTHELARETRLLDRARKQLAKLAKEQGSPVATKAAEDLQASLSRLKSMQGLFAPLLSEEDRKGDKRLRVQPIVNQVVDAMRPLVPGLDFSVKVPGDLRFPNGSLASWNAILQNLIANSWNAVLDASEARVEIEGLREGNREYLYVSDTGVGLGVDIEDAKRLFDPFERNLHIDPDRRSIAIGGTGMGLTIVKMICDRHGVRPQFVEAADPFETCLELSWKS